MQKPWFFQCETAFDARAETPPGGAINAPCGHQMLLFAMNQLHSPTEKKQPKKVTKMKKSFVKSEICTPLQRYAPQVRPPWKKGAWNTVKMQVFIKWAPRCSERRGAHEYVVNYYVFVKFFWWKKKSKKVKSNKTYVFYWSGWRNVSQNHSFYRKWFWATKSQQQKAESGGEWFCVCVVTLDT